MHYTWVSASEGGGRGRWRACTAERQRVEAAEAALERLRVERVERYRAEQAAVVMEVAERLRQEEESNFVWM